MPARAVARKPPNFEELFYETRLPHPIKQHEEQLASLRVDIPALEIVRDRARREQEITGRARSMATVLIRERRAHAGEATVGIVVGPHPFDELALDETLIELDKHLTNFAKSGAEGLGMTTGTVAVTCDSAALGQWWTWISARRSTAADPRDPGAARMRVVVALIASAAT